MKRCLLLALALTLVLTACGPADNGPDDSASSIGSRPPAAGELLPEEKEETPDPQPAQQPASSQEEVVEPQPPQPDPEFLAQWREQFSTPIYLLGNGLYDLAQSYSMTVYSRWPDGLERVRLENTCLYFSGPATHDRAACAAVALDLSDDLDLAQLQETWGGALEFRSEDPLTGPCLAYTDGELTYRFRTDAAGENLLPRSQGGNLVLSKDALIPETPTAGWIAPADTWVDLWAVTAAAGWEPLLPYAAALGSSVLPEGATEEADPFFLDLFYAGHGVKDPATGVQYFAVEEADQTPWEGVSAPASLVFGETMPQNADQVMQALNTPYWWGVFNMTGYWFSVDQYSIFLSSDEYGAIGEDSYFLIAWGDNAGPDR